MSGRQSATGRAASCTARSSPPRPRSRGAARSRRRRTRGTSRQRAARGMSSRAAASGKRRASDIGLRRERLHERAHVEGRRERRHVAVPGREVVRDRERGGGGDEALAGVLAEPLEEDVPAERDTRREDRPAVPRHERPEDEVEVRRLAGVVEARALVRDRPREVRKVARAETEVQDRGPETRLHREREEALGVDGVRAALEPVEDQERRRAGRNGRVRVVEEERVAVGRRQRLAAEGDLPAGAREAPPDRLQVSASQPPGGREARAVRARHFGRLITTTRPSRSATARRRPGRSARPDGFTKRWPSGWSLPRAVARSVPSGA